MIGSCGSSTSSKICSGNSPKKQSRRFVRRLCFVRARVITLAVFRQAIGCRSVFKREQRASCFSLNYALFFVLLHGLSSEAVLKRVRFCVYWENALRHSRGKGFDPPHLHQKKASAKAGAFVRYFTHSTCLPAFGKMGPSNAREAFFMKKHIYQVPHSSCVAYMLP